MRERAPARVGADVGVAVGVGLGVGVGVVVGLGVGVGVVVGVRALVGLAMRIFPWRSHWRAWCASRSQGIICAAGLAACLIRARATLARR